VLHNTTPPSQERERSTLWQRAAWRKGNTGRHCSRACRHSSSLHSLGRGPPRNTRVQASRAYAAGQKRGRGRVQHRRKGCVRPQTRPSHPNNPSQTPAQHALPVQGPLRSWALHYWLPLPSALSCRARPPANTTNRHRRSVVHCLLHTLDGLMDGQVGRWGLVG
jgi:hypothetical protein